MNFLMSSADPEKVAATVKGFILMFTSLIVLYGSRNGIVIPEADIIEWATTIGTAIGSIWALFGLLRKVYYWRTNRYN